MLEAIKKQVDELCFAGPGFATEPRGQLGKKLASVTGLAKTFFTLGGSEANENAMKMARLSTGHDKIITRYRSYHGATMGSMSASGDPRRWPVEPGLPGIVRVFDPYCYRCPFGQKVETCHRECVSHIEEVIQMERPNTIAAILVEGITGSNGLLTPSHHYYQKLLAPGNRNIAAWATCAARYPSALSSLCEKRPRGNLWLHSMEAVRRWAAWLHI